jgi:16S rRNA U1498 N3-methylase RsmE
MTRRRWIAEHWDEATATLTGAQAEHMTRVLRAQPGMEADVVAGGHVFHAQVAAVANDEVRFNLITELEADPALPVTLVMAVYKFDHMEWAIEKATELGVAAIAPVIARRTEKHLAAGRGKRAERWRRIAHEAAQQSRRSDVPILFDPTPLAIFVCVLLQKPPAQLRHYVHCAGRAGANHHAALAWRKPWPRLERRRPNWKLPSALKADGLLRKKRSSTPTAGEPHRSARAS